MQIIEVFVFGIVWGGLMLFFLSPFKKTGSVQKNTKINFSYALKQSVLRIALHKKAILAFVMLIITLIFIWYYHSQLEWHNKAHGGGVLTIEPTKQAIYYMVSIIVYTLILYLLLAFRRTSMLLKKS